MARHIQPKMVAYIDAKLAGSSNPRNAPLLAAIGKRDARTVFRLAAEACVGIRETGGNRGALVELIQSTIGAAVEEPWCMSLVQTCLAYAEFKTGILSPILASESCLEVWRSSPVAQRVESNPLAGAICIWQHGQGGNGHTGVVLGYSTARRTMDLVEGNTSGGYVGGEVVRNGGGCYFTHRSTGSVGDMHVLGFLKPFTPEAGVAS